MMKNDFNFCFFLWFWNRLLAMIPKNKDPWQDRPFKNDPGSGSNFLSPNRDRDRLQKYWAINDLGKDTLFWRKERRKWKNSVCYNRTMISRILLDMFRLVQMEIGSVHKWPLGNGLVTSRKLYHFILFQITVPDHDLPREPQQQRQLGLQWPIVIRCWSS